VASTPLRAVFDTSVLVSAFIDRTGLSSELLRLAGDAFTLLLAPPIVAETESKLLTKRQLRRKNAYADATVGEYCRALELLAAMVTDLPPLSGVVRDPNDDVIVAAALAARADYLVSRDKDLLALGSYQGVAVVTPEAFRGILRQRGA
jgi:uncharacterized protein